MRLHEPGDFTGELDMLSGRPSLVRARTVDPTEVVELDQGSLRNLVQTDPELGEFLLRVCVSRRCAEVYPRARNKGTFLHDSYDLRSHAYSYEPPLRF